MTTVSSLVEINQQQAEQIKQLNAERDAFESDVDTLAQHNIELQQDNARLRAALDDAATSLETIAIRSYGEESYIDSKQQMRGYAGASRISAVIIS